jgi:hypothetical protein
MPKGMRAFACFDLDLVVSVFDVSILTRPPPPGCIGEIVALSLGRMNGLKVAAGANTP